MTTLTRTNGPEAGPSMEAVELALVDGDVTRLSANERIAYYKMRCEAAGLDPRSQPFQYIQLPGQQGRTGKLTLYATKSATDQLIFKHRLNVQIVSRGFDRDTGCYAVQCRVGWPDGHTVEDVGVVWISDAISGEPLANAQMKAVTKAKRRTVLSACGLGVLDETEVDSVSDAVKVEPQPVPAPAAPSPQQRGRRVIAPPGREFSEPIPDMSDVRRFIEDTVTAANDSWRNHCLIEQREFKPLCNVFQLANHLVSAWIAEGALEPDMVEEQGKRDKHKVARILREAWETDQDGLMQDVGEYIKAKLRERAAEAGIALADEGESIAAVKAEAGPAPAPSPAGVEGTEEQDWEPGRE